MVYLTGISEDLRLLRFKCGTYPEHEYEVARNAMSYASKDIYNDYYVNAARIHDLVDQDSKFCKVRLTEFEFNTIRVIYHVIESEVKVPYVARVTENRYETSYRKEYVEVQCMLDITPNRLREELTNKLSKIENGYFVRVFNCGSIFIQNQDTNIMTPQFMYIPEETIEDFLEVKIGEAITEEGDKLSL